MTLDDNSSFLGCITSGDHLVIWKVLNSTLEKDKYGFFCARKINLLEKIFL